MSQGDTLNHELISDESISLLLLKNIIQQSFAGIRDLCSVEQTRESLCEHAQETDQDIMVQSAIRGLTNIKIYAKGIQMIFDHNPRTKLVIKETIFGNEKIKVHGNLDGVAFFKSWITNAWEEVKQYPSSILPASWEKDPPRFPLRTIYGTMDMSPLDPEIITSIGTRGREGTNNTALSKMNVVSDDIPSDILEFINRGENQGSTRPQSAVLQKVPLRP